jgi:hypothetical protein
VGIAEIFSAAYSNISRSSSKGNLPVEAMKEMPEEKMSITAIRFWDSEVAKRTTGVHTTLQ